MNQNHSWNYLGAQLGAAILFASSTFAQSFSPNQDFLPASPPANAMVLLAADGTHQFVSMKGEEINWPIKEGELISSQGEGNRSSNHIVSNYHFRDACVHVEFLLPEEGNGNSGIYLHGNYEMQIFRSYRDAESENGGVEILTDKEMGAVYGFYPPLVNSARPTGEWQVYDVQYMAPRRDTEGMLIKEGEITAWLNGKLVQDHVRIGEPRSVYHPYRYGTTPYLEEIEKLQKQTSTGPVFLQDHSNRVRFRNIWVVPLDYKAYFYKK